MSLGYVLTFVSQMKKLRAENAARDSAAKAEYIKEINEVKATIQALKSSYQTSVATLTLKIDSLEKKQDLHNSVIQRVYGLETSVATIDNRIKVAEHREADIEQDLRDMRRLNNDGK